MKHDKIRLLALLVWKLYRIPFVRVFCRLTKEEREDLYEMAYGYPYPHDHPHTHQHSHPHSHGHPVAAKPMAAKEVPVE